MKIVTEKEWEYLSKEEKDHFTGLLLFDDKSEMWYKNGLLHSYDDKPAFTDTRDNEKYWYYEEKLHNLKGPAILTEKVSLYYILGKHYNKTDWILKSQQFQDLLEYKKL